MDRLIATYEAEIQRLKDEIQRAADDYAEAKDRMHRDQVRIFELRDHLNLAREQADKYLRLLVKS